MPNLKIAAEKLDGFLSCDQIEEVPPVVTKVDVTRDLKGSLYARDDWKEKHQELAAALEEKFDTTFRDNGNSFDSCFQFVGRDLSGLLSMRIKYYWKNLSLFQSESVQKSLGMNTKAIFYPSMRMGKALRESKDEGLSRIEITYIAKTSEAENELFHPLFGRKSEVDLNLAQAALDQVPDICHKLPMKEMYD